MPVNVSTAAEFAALASLVERNGDRIDHLDQMTAEGFLEADRRLVDLEGARTDHAVLLSNHTDRIVALEARIPVDAVTPPPPAGAVTKRGNLVEVTERIGARALNDLIQARHDAGGGRIAVMIETGDVWNEPIVQRPGVILEGNIAPAIYGPLGGRMRTTHSGPVFLILDEHSGPSGSGDFQAWGASQTRGFQVETRDGQEALVQIEGGNVGDVELITSVGGKVDHTLLVDQGRRYDGQYLTARRVSSTRTRSGLTILRGIPDSTFSECLWYGSSTLGSDGRPSNTSDRGIYLADDVHSIEIVRCHSQFNALGYSIGGRENKLLEGSWENKSSDHIAVKEGRAAPWATVLDVRPSTRDLVVDWLSLANTGSARSIITAGPGVSGAFSFTTQNKPDVIDKLGDLAPYVRLVEEVM